MSGRNVFTVLKETVARCGNAAALHQPTGSKTGEKYRSYTWNDWLGISSELALGLRALGLARGDIACVLSETRAEFYLVDLGIMGAGAISAALYTAYPIQDQAKNIQAVTPAVLFVETPEKWASLQKAAAAQSVQLPEHVILMTGEGERAKSLEDVLRLGRTQMEANPAALEQQLEEISPDDSAILYLTSGATGEPKMGLTSHKAVLANIDMGPMVLPMDGSDRTLVFLPSAHIAQRIVLQLLPMRMGTPVWFSESLARMPGEIKAIKPTFFLAPPRVWERIYVNVVSELRKKPPALQKLFHGALGLGSEAARLRREGKPEPFWMKGVLAAASKIFFAKIHARLGGHLRVAASGAAPLGKELSEFFAGVGLPLIEGYGLTEAGVATFNPLDRPKPGSIGKLLPGVEARLAGDGELQLKTPCLFQGYYRDEAATRSVILEDGWFATGDIASQDAEGYWYITGRKKELIVSSNGKKIYPSRIEGLFKIEPIFSHVVLVGDKRPYVTALFTLNLANLKSLKVLSDSDAVKESELGANGQVKQAVQEAVSRVNKQLADFERIRRFRVLDRDFTIEQGELTATMKIRRSRVLENHKELVSELYLGREESE